MKFQTTIPVPFEVLTQEQIDEMCNGCGGKGSWVVPPKAIFFDADCDHHDYGYWKGVTEQERLICDRKLKAEMKKDCARLSWYKKPLYYPWVYIYYVAVRHAGGSYFYYGKEKRWPVPSVDQLAKIEALNNNIAIA